MQKIKSDFLASLVVFIVALPLSLGIAMASGVSPAAGLLTAIVGGIVCGLMSGAPLVVAGPAAGMIAIVLPLVEKYGLEGLAIITVVAGLTQLIMGMSRLGFIFTYVPKVVLSGMLSVIGFTIALYQIHVLLGSSSPKGVTQAVQLLPAVLTNAPLGVVVCGAFALVVQIFWARAPQSVRWIPGALPAVVGATLLSLMWEMPRVQIDNFIAQVLNSASAFSFSVFNVHGFSLVLAGLTVALVASAETLLTAIAIDGLTSNKDEPKKSNLNKELVAHGYSNMLSGFLGGIPLTGVIVRSAVNINSGAKTRWSTILHGIWVGLFVCLMPEVLQKIPLTALAAVLVYTGVKLINVNEFLLVWKNSKFDASKWAVTFMAILFTDLLVGLIIGILFSLIFERVVEKIRLTKERARA